MAGLEIGRRPCFLSPMFAAAVLAAALSLAAPPPPPALQSAVVPVKLHLPQAAADAYALKRAGIARTSVDRRLGSDQVSGSLGLLCGRQPDAGMSGAAQARGADPDGKFLGGKLSLAF